MANCKNCSAPLPPRAIVCAYCGTRNDIDLKGVHRHTVTAPHSQRDCPRCRKPLQTVDLNIEGPFLIERCERCLGLFFDPGELEALLEHSVKHVYVIDHQKLNVLATHLRHDEYGVAYIPCPVCGKIMNRVAFGARSGVVVDRCGDHGVWLDGGELRQLMEWTRAGGQMYHQESQKRRQQERQRQQQRRERERLAQMQRYGRGEHTARLGSFGRSLSRRRPENERLLGLLSKAAGLLLK